MSEKALLAYKEQMNQLICLLAAGENARNTLEIAESSLCSIIPVLMLCMLQKLKALCCVEYLAHIHFKPSALSISYKVTNKF